MSRAREEGGEREKEEPRAFSIFKFLIKLYKETYLTALKDQ